VGAKDMKAKSCLGCYKKIMDGYKNLKKYFLTKIIKFEFDGCKMKNT
jgi:hypothetical protein